MANDVFGGRSCGGQPAAPARACEWAVVIWRRMHRHKGRGDDTAAENASEKKPRRDVVEERALEKAHGGRGGVEERPMWEERLASKEARGGGGGAKELSPPEKWLAVGGGVREVAPEAESGGGRENER